MTNHKSLNFIIAGALALIIGLWFGLSSDIYKTENSKMPPAISGVILPVAKNISDFSLQDHNRQIYSKQNLKGKWSVLFLGYAQCPDVCPATLSIMKQVVRLLAEQGETIPETVFVSVDPDRDTAEILAEYVSYFNSAFIGVTGEHNQLKKLAIGLSVFYQKSAGMSGDINADDYLMDHSAALMLINPEGSLQAFLTAPHDAKKIAESIVKTKEFYNQNLAN
ncbi:MAG: SCO family protein [Gammaproteobacteria bacterium]|nr:SCO family protein [Gammaproteobacteria bacterium]MCW8911274.1 SCO family protein [Gammaproteobacteria bacterium]MCW9005988.1 SCO family protein [Gammaproteobacteria bacterium]MCW9055489.1 SCO family protein [Gammaproteobacteria bacterium]